PIIRPPAHAAAAGPDGSWAGILPPSGRYGHSAVYDPVRDRMIMFGGYDGDRRSDTWVLSFAGSPVWTRLAPSGTPPPPRFAHTAIYDPLRDRVIVFGLDDDDFQDPVWILSLSGEPAWSQLSTTGTIPPGLFEHSAIYDPVRDRMIVFGGFTTSAHRETWALALSGSPQWTELSVAGTPPPARDRHSAIYDPEG